MMDLSNHLAPAPRPAKTPRKSPKQVVRKVRPKSKNVARQREEGPRKYGSRERRRWIKAQPCVGCGLVGYSVNAHVAPKIEAGGVGRKADAKWIAPLCEYFNIVGVLTGCHLAYDNHKPPFDTEAGRQKIKDAAAEIAQAWQLVAGGGR